MAPAAVMCCRALSAKNAAIKWPETAPAVPVQVEQGVAVAVAGNTHMAQHMAQHTAYTAFCEVDRASGDHRQLS
jgi:hypothetical protein